ncbi:hypothetical protein FGIG_00500 [Fasciola gigantica]|uniref:Uncharacterized protein n=1 Tax=Fasciola gigantica TaxID=46835 RepID=A0A504YGG4_FASGI|nr:hypothetical protein FGIG_00500 [Fasciola gigantica]
MTVFCSSLIHSVCTQNTSEHPHLAKVSFSSLCGYRLYCPRTERILVPPLFLKLLAPGSRGAPTTTGLEVSPNGPMIRKNRALFKESDPFVYQLRFGTK